MHIKRFLFLQGVCSPFFSRLAQKLRSEGHQVFQVTFNAGDWLYGGWRGVRHHRGKADEVSDFLLDCYLQLGITDQILFGDCRPIHIQARHAAKLAGVESHVFEEGYFRPYWVTLERNGVNANSLLPRDPDWYRRAGRNLPDYGDGISFKHSFKWRAIHDVIYHLAGAWNPILYPGYKNHSPISAPVDYAYFIQRMAYLHSREKTDTQFIYDLTKKSTESYFVFPLQLNSDSQIRIHSPFKDMTAPLEIVLRSFALHAPNKAKLVIKNHPLDNGMANHEKTVQALAKKYDLLGRVHYLDSGNLHKLLTNASGMVTINSTAGSQSLGLGCPTICLANPIYNLPGLTFEGDLDHFWCSPYAPDATLFKCFKNTVIHTTQVNGGFYSTSGINLAVENAKGILTSNYSRLEKLLQKHPLSTKKPINKQLATFV